MRRIRFPMVDIWEMAGFPKNQDGGQNGRRYIITIYRHIKFYASTMCDISKSSYWCVEFRCQTRLSTSLILVVKNSRWRPKEFPNLQNIAVKSLILSNPVM